MPIMLKRIEARKSRFWRPASAICVSGILPDAQKRMIAPLIIRQPVLTLEIIIMEMKLEV